MMSPDEGTSPVQPLGALRIRPATTEDQCALAAVAAATFPLACPPSVAPRDVASFIAAHLSAGRFGDYLADPDRMVLTATATATAESRIIGYAMLIHGIGDDPDIAASMRRHPAVKLSKMVELSKMYVLPTHHRTGAAAGLMQAGITWATACGARALWLGVNKNNERAQRFYRRHGFEVAGTRTFRLGTGTEADFVMVRPV